MNKVTVIGGGLAGAEACYQLAKRGVNVDLYEMRPEKTTPAHKTGDFAELVCSNSLKSADVNTAQGALKREMKLLDSLIIRAAENTSVPAGGALAVDREKFSEYIKTELNKFDNINVIREERTEITDYTIIATGPLSSDGISESLASVTGGGYLNFFDAVAPIVTGESVYREKSFFAGRYGKGGEDYLNCPLNREEYYDFVDNLVKADKVILRDFEKKDVFNACMPVEVMAGKGADTLRFGPLRPVGLTDPSTGRRPFAAVQLRKEDKDGRLYNLVGFQTNLKFGEQQRVFSMIPALRNAEFVRYGVMHRNTFLDAPKALSCGFELKNRPTVFVAGQLSGVEGYAESAMSGLISGINMYRRLVGKDIIDPPEETLIGGLMKYVITENKDFQPMHVGFPLTPGLEEKIKDKQKRKEAYSLRAEKAFSEFIKNYI